MQYKISISNVKSVDEIPGYWSADDYKNLLKEFDFPDADSSSVGELKDLLYMAISDFEADEAASILLKYKLSEALNEGQIQQISHEMLEDKICEEYPDISLHHEMFHINQLLYKAYNGRFPHAKATIIDFSISPDQDISAEIILKLLSRGLSERCVLKRLFADQLDNRLTFPEAESIVWTLAHEGEGKYSLLTSEYWLEKDDLQSKEIEAEVSEFIEEDED